MTKCSYCSAEELLPFTCRYCGDKFCREHHLPEKHECTGLSQAGPAKRRAGGHERTVKYQRAYEIPGVMEVLVRPRQSREKARAGYFEVDEKLVAAGMLILILLLGLLARLL